MKQERNVSIGNRVIGNGNPAFIIAEVGQSHDGSLGMAHSYIDLISESGADAVKFQTHIANSESTADEKFRVNFSYQDETRYDYWKRMEFTYEQWKGLADHAHDKGLVFLSSPFSVEAFYLLEKLNVHAWKIGSGEISNSLLFTELLKTNKPVLLSTGMSNWKEICDTVQKVQNANSPLAIFQCTSKYPTEFKDVGVNVISELKKKFFIPVGLSDHSGSIFPSLNAIAQGANIIELHVCLHKRMFGPDTSSSIDFNELKLLSEGRDAFHIMNSNTVNKDAVSKEMQSMRNLFNKNLALLSDKKASTILDASMLTAKKPGTGIPVSELSNYIGRVLRKDVSANRLLREGDLIDE